MSELQDRRYKEVEPAETVKRLKKILKDMKIEVEEVWGKRSSVGTYSLRVRIKGTDIGQNGKGMTKEYAMASGYAEFFERLQNGIFRFRMEKPTQEIPFCNAPDEKYLSIEELVKNNNSILENIFKKNKFETKNLEEKVNYMKDNFYGKGVEGKYLSVPYYSVKYKQIQYMPDQLFNYLFGSNGMCAGNSAEEALIEGLSEIVERYVGIRILKERLTLPQIPESYLENFPKVKHMVERQKEKFGWEFLFLGANIDAAAEAGRFGINADRAVQYHCDSEGTEVNYRVLSKAVSRVRKCKSVAMMADALAEWDDEIREDYCKRRK